MRPDLPFPSIRFHGMKELKEGLENYHALGGLTGGNLTTLPADVQQMEVRRMEKNIVDVIVHIDETLGHDQLQALAQSVRELDGVVSATFRDAQPHMMIVNYHPERTSSSAIHDLVVEKGRVHAELVGL